ncbi:VOC family protein [Brevibacterium casei]|uniref:Glyoxalase/bleomycin resistance protein/dioxygenase n=2 Tax=Brevibacterium casei TaxID=33889 RepID=K9AP40_9MICO|nr:VOC family protein [Brevibacterium casei]EKU49183.1 glyoxalase/bleomycin resistance protein/dioxygenase [Brevibacterium casei S18]MCT1549921.1 VOC family protein [Brevibacterium casei]MCT1558815.1 VOC family protein [Brevibacterium casei]MCT1764775.1 VOC family protein [Brevibacterium casei]MCT2207944.1 VOC family protein [Brevibacterium casei]
MRPAAVVVCLPAADLERSLRFYRECFDLEPSDADDIIVAFELPHLSLFLIAEAEYRTYLDRAGVGTAAVPAPGAVIVSCAITSPGEVDDVAQRAAAAGGRADPPVDLDGSHTAYIHDPDGHVWELVSNEQTARAAE